MKKKFIYLVYQIIETQKYVGEHPIIPKAFTNKKEVIKVARIIVEFDNKYAMSKPKVVRKNVTTEVRRYEFIEKSNLINLEEVWDYVLNYEDKLVTMLFIERIIYVFNLKEYKY